MVPHPLDQYIVIKVQTVDLNDQKVKVDPLSVFSKAVRTVHKDAHIILEKFTKSLREVKRSEIHY